MLYYLIVVYAFINVWRIPQKLETRRYQLINHRYKFCNFSFLHKPISIYILLFIQGVIVTTCQCCQPIIKYYPGVTVTCVNIGSTTQYSDVSGWILVMRLRNVVGQWLSYYIIQGSKTYIYYLIWYDHSITVRQLFVSDISYAI